MLDELKAQQRELERNIKDERDKAVEKALVDFMTMLLDDRIPLEIKQDTLVNSYKATILNIFSK